MVGRVRGPDERWPLLAEVRCDFHGCNDTVDVGGEGEDDIGKAREASRSDYGWTGDDGEDFCEKHRKAN